MLFAAPDFQDLAHMASIHRFNFRRNSGFIAEVAVVIQFDVIRSVDSVRTENDSTVFFNNFHGFVPVGGPAWADNEDPEPRPPRRNLPA